MVYRFDRQPSEGFITAITFRAGQSLEVMSPEGYLQTIDYGALKAVCFIAEGGEALLFRENTLFERRPKVPGLWTRFELRDGDQLDGVLAHNLAEWPEAGFLLTPPKSGSQRQRVFLPRVAVRATELRGIIGKSPEAKVARRSRDKTTDAQDQLSMFE